MGKAESNFNPKAVSPAGAMGLMQFMPGTAKDMGLADPYDPHSSIDAAGKYLRQLMDRYKGDTRKAVMAYNAGPGNIDKYGYDVPFEETQNYAKKVLGGLFGSQSQVHESVEAPQLTQPLETQSFADNGFFKFIERLMPSIAGERKYANT